MNQLTLVNPEGRYGLDYIPVMRYYSDGVQVKPQSATITVYDSNSVTVCTARFCTIGTTGDIMAALTAAELTDYWRKYYIELTLGLGSAAPVVVGSVTFWIVKTPLVCPVIDDDLKKVVPRLASEIWDEQANYATQIFLAFDDVKARIMSKQDSPAALIDAAQIKTPIVWRALWYIFCDFSSEPGDKWAIRAQMADKEYDGSFDSLLLDVDEDSDKRFDDVEQQDAGVVRMYS